MSETVTRFTTAPEAYDYGYVEVINPCVAVDAAKPAKVWREIKLPVSHLDYQSGRYLSGWFPCVDAEEFAKLRAYNLIKDPE